MKQYQNIIFMAGAILTLAGAATFITGWNLSPYIFTAGALMVAIIQIVAGYKKGDTTILKRLYKQQMFGGIALLVTALFMFTTKQNEWVACLCIAAFLEIYTAFRISHEEEKNK